MSAVDGCGGGAVPTRRWTDDQVADVIDAAEACRWSEVAAALDAGFPVNAAHPSFWKDCLLHKAAIKGHMATLTRLLAAGSDVNRRGYVGMTPFYMAAFSY